VKNYGLTPKRGRGAVTNPDNRYYKPETIVLGANTDPYQPLERRLGITREVLEVLRDCRHPVAVTTKSALVLRDLDLLGEMAADRLAAVQISITTLDAGLARRLEPRAASPKRRLKTIHKLANAGIPVGVQAQRLRLRHPVYRQGDR